MKARAAVPRPVVFLLLTAILSGAGPAAGATLFVTNTKSDSASIIDTDTLEAVGTIPLGQGKPNRIVFHPDGRTAWVVYDKSHDLGVIDAEARKLIKREIPLPGIVHEATLTLDGKYLYTTLRKSNKIVVVRASNDKIVATIPQKGYPDLVTMEPTGRRALVTNRWADLVSVIDLASHDQVRTIPVGKAPHGMALRPR